MDDFDQSNPASFDAMFYGYAKWINEAYTTYLISLTDVKVENDTTVYKGQTTVTMKEGQIAKLPAEIKMHTTCNNNMISIWFRPYLK